MALSQGDIDKIGGFLSRFRQEQIKRTGGQLQSGQSVAVEGADREAFVKELAAEFERTGLSNPDQSLASAEANAAQALRQLDPVSSEEIISGVSQVTRDIATAEQTGSILGDAAPVTLTGVTEAQAGLARSLDPLKVETAALRGETAGLISGISDISTRLGEREASVAGIQERFAGTAGLISGLREDVGSLRGGEALQQLASTGLTDADRAATAARLGVIGVGRQRALEGIEQTARTQASSRGLFSSRGAIEEEAAGLAQVPLFEAQQRAGVLGQQAQQARSGLLSGTQALSGLISQESSLIGAEQATIGAEAGFEGQRAGLLGQQLGTQLQQIPALQFASGLISQQAGLAGAQAGFLQGSSATEISRAGLLGQGAGIEQNLLNTNIQREQFEIQIQLQEEERKRKENQGFLSALTGIGSLFTGTSGLFGQSANTVNVATGGGSIARTPSRFPTSTSRAGSGSGRGFSTTPTFQR